MEAKAGQGNNTRRIAQDLARAVMKRGNTRDPGGLPDLWIV